MLVSYVSATPAARSLFYVVESFWVLCFVFGDVPGESLVRVARYVTADLGNVALPPWSQVGIHGSRYQSPEPEGVDWDGCNHQFEAPAPGNVALVADFRRGHGRGLDRRRHQGDHGLQLARFSFCQDQHHVFIIGDWGGLPADPEMGQTEPVTADHRKDGFHKREFVAGLDDVAQLAVRDRMRERAADIRPEETRFLLGRSGS
ncbi:unnamed protein product [Prorocentrum cordatum]|uniref:Uncharacterized protein n=1 Tax=Prorocentrum cordatum TaxID=2364126 RepID=A0ABN9WA84_9DINO|nr:unnamed protein product [Polarella glacialis]